MDDSYVGVCLVSKAFAELSPDIGLRNSTVTGQTILKSRWHLKSQDPPLTASTASLEGIDV